MTNNSKETEAMRVLNRLPDPTESQGTTCGTTSASRDAAIAAENAARLPNRFGIKGFAGSRNFLDDKKGAVAIMFAILMVPVLLFAGIAIDYQMMLLDRSKFQAGADQAAIYTARSVGQYMLSNNAYPSASTISSFLTTANNMVSAATGGHGSIASTDFHVCTPANNDCSATVNGSAVTLSYGQVALKVAGSQTRTFSGLIGGGAVPVGAGAVAGTGATPATINYQFQYAKGWYYKVVTLWSVPIGSSTPTALATWTYQATNTADVAYPKGTLPYFPSNPSDTGIGIVTTWYNSNTVVDSSGTITLPAYSTIYLTMQVENSVCPPGQTQTSASSKGTYSAAATASQLAFYNLYYSNVSSTATTVQCSGTANSTYNMTMSTNSPTNSNYIYINGIEQPPSETIPLMDAFPCPQNPLPGQTATNYYEWEDSNNSTSGDRDFFFSLTTTCSTSNLFGGAPMLLH